MEVSALEQLLHELLPCLEALEGQTSAILQFMHDKGLATDEELAPYLEQANNAADVRWRAARLRLNRILATAEDAETESNATDKADKKETEQFSKPESADKEPVSKENNQPAAKTVESGDSNLGDRKLTKAEQSSEPQPAEAKQTRNSKPGESQPDDKSSSAQQPREEAAQSEHDEAA